MVFIGTLDWCQRQEKVRYLGEGLVREAISLGLGTCWVAACFRPEVAAARVGSEKGERVVAATPIGDAAGKWSWEERMMTGWGRSHRRKPIPEGREGLREEDWSDWMRTALEAARLAPPVVERQP